MGDFEDDRAEIIALIHANRIAMWTQDHELYQQCFVQEPYTTRFGWWRPGGSFVRHGWDEIWGRVLEQFRNPDFNNPANAHETRVENLRIRIGVDMAWATFDQIYPPMAIAGFRDGPSLTHEARIFERHDGRWRIAFLGFLDANTVGGDTVALRLGKDGAVIWQSPSGMEALRDHDELVIRNGRLRIRNGRADQKLQAAVRWAAQLADHGVMGRHGAVPVVIDGAEGVPAQVCWVIADGGLILFSMGNPTLSQTRLDMAAAIYGLSPAQKTLAGHVAEGMTLNEIAEVMGITANTARTHLQRVFDKTGVHTQTALVRVLLSTAAPI